MDTLVYVIQILMWILCPAIIGLILLQGAAGDISSAFGGGGQLDASLGVGAHRKMAQVTGALAAVFFIMVLIMAYPHRGSFKNLKNAPVTPVPTQTPAVVPPKQPTATPPVAPEAAKPEAAKPAESAPLQAEAAKTAAEAEAVPAAQLEAVKPVEAAKPAEAAKPVEAAKPAEAVHTTPLVVPADPPKP